MFYGTLSDEILCKHQTEWRMQEYVKCSSNLTSAMGQEHDGSGTSVTEA